MEAIASRDSLVFSEKILVILLAIRNQFTGMLQFREE